MYPYHGPHHYSHHPHHFDTEDVGAGAAAIGLIVIIGLLVAAVVFLPKPNYAGTGNYFDITATVTGHTNESVLVDEVQVNEAEGEPPAQIAVPKEGAPVEPGEPVVNKPVAPEPEYHPAVPAEPEPAFHPAIPAAE